MKKLLIRAGTLIDGLSDEPMQDVAILVEGETITSVSPWSPPQSDAELLDFTGKTVMPGLINAHIHLGLQPYPSDPVHEMPFAFSVLIARQLKSLLHSGVTLVRNLGTNDYYDLHARRAVEEGLAEGPDILASGPVLTTPDGHGNYLGIHCQGLEACEQRAREIAEHGVDVLKLIATGGMLTKGTNLDAAPYSLEELTAMVKVAEEYDLPSAVHAHGTTGMRNSVLAGVTTVEHGTFMEDDIIEEMLKRGTWLCPTLTAPHSIKHFGRAGGLDEEVVQKMDRAYDIRMANFEKCYRAGVKIGCGTDAGTPDNPFDKTWFELKMMIDHGVPAMKAIQIATSKTAEMLRRTQYGAVSPGRFADMIVLENNPLADIAALKTPSRVIKKGTVYV